MASRYPEDLERWRESARIAAEARELALYFRPEEYLAYSRVGEEYF